MRLFEILAITDSKQQVVILDMHNNVLEEDSCICIYECNSNPHKLVKSQKVIDGKLHIAIDLES